MGKYIENIKKNILLVSISIVGGWWATLRCKDSLVYAYIDYVALFLVILFYGSILYLIYKNDKSSKLLRISLYTIYSLCFLMSCYVLLTSADVFLLNLVYLCYDIIFALAGCVYAVYLLLNRKKIERILERYTFLGWCFFFVTYLFMIHFVRYIEFV
jgi:hypothetical protein